MNTLSEIHELDPARTSETDLFRAGLLEAVRSSVPDPENKKDLDFAFVCVVGDRLADSEEFQDFIPCQFPDGTGQRGRKLRVDGYEVDEADDSIRLLIADFKGGPETETITKTRVEALFSQLQAFIEESAEGRLGSAGKGDISEVLELSKIVRQRHSTREDGTKAVSRYRLYLITDSSLSDRLRELEPTEFDGVPVEFHVWDINRLKSVCTSVLGTEEIEISFSDFTDGGLPCLLASETDDYDGYLCVIPADTLAAIYDRYGSRLLEGNVRTFLSTTGKINKGIQSTIRKEPGRFFVYNNGISAIATSAEIQETASGLRLISARYLQIVNGGQTTASLHAAKRKDSADLQAIQIQMKLTVVNAKDPDTLDSLIQKIAEFSNKQNKVSDADFFSNHPFHRAIEQRSRNIPAPPLGGSQSNTYWFYERARGQYFHEQSKLTLAQKKEFQRKNPRSQVITKTDLAKYENSIRRLPQFVSKGAQKNFLEFAKFIGANYGEDGRAFNNDIYFKQAVAHAILFKFTERLVTQARGTWYEGDYRAQIVTYTLAKLIDQIEQKAPSLRLDVQSIWKRQGVSPALGAQLEDIAKKISKTITAPPAGYRNVGEWCKKDDCWKGVSALQIPLQSDLRSELISTDQDKAITRDGVSQGQDDASINAVTEVVRLCAAGCWTRLIEWSQKHTPIYGKEADLARNATRRSWIPSDLQARALMKLLERFEKEEGFKR